MSRRLPDLPVTVAFSTRGVLMPAWMSQHVAADAGLGMLDQDACSPTAAWFASRSGNREAYVPTASLWMPIDTASSDRGRRLLHQIAERQDGVVPSVIVQVNSLQHRDLSRQVPALQRSLQAPLLIGLATSQLRGGRPHLVQLGGLRRFAEEWDLSVAVDLAGRLDPTWEAEAAVTRLGPRLTVLRVRDSAPSRSAVGLDRVAFRALNAVLDRESQALIAVAPSRLTPFPITPRAASINAQRAADYVRERNLLHISALRDGIDRFEQSRSSRGA